MNSTERRLNLLVLLQSNQNWNVNQMAEHFGVSRRTIFRDLKTFSELNIPVTYDRDTGYGMMKGFSIPPIMFTPKELSTVLVGLSFVESQVDETMVKDAQAVQYKINSVLPTDELKRFMKSLGEKTIVDPYKKYAAEKRKGGDWFTIANAISKQHEITFSYISMKEETKTSRQVRPFLLVYFTDHWTLIGYCKTRKGIRSFRLDRLTDVELTPHAFNLNRVPGEKSLLFRTKDEAIQIKVRVHADSADRFKISVPAIIEKQEVKKDGVEYTFSFDNLDYINEWLFAFHNHIKVLSPESLVQKRVMMIRDMLKSI